MLSTTSQVLSSRFSAASPHTMAVQTLHKDHRGHRRGPQPFLTEGQNQSERKARTFSKATDRPGVENEHELTCHARRASCDPLRERLCPGLFLWGRLANLSHQPGRVSVRLSEQVEPTCLRTHRLLKELRSG
jgi:hypothetical protein